MEMKYQLVQSGNGKDLENVVNRLLQEGWEAQGGVSVTQIHNRDSMPDMKETIYTQAVILDGQ